MTVPVTPHYRAAARYRRGDPRCRRREIAGGLDRLAGFQGVLGDPAAGRGATELIRPESG